MQIIVFFFFQPIYDEIEELPYAKRYQNVFDQQISDFVLTKILKSQIEEEFFDKICPLDTQDEFYETKKNSLEIQKKRAGLRVLEEKIKANKNKKN